MLESQKMYKKKLSKKPHFC